MKQFVHIIMGVIVTAGFIVDISFPSKTLKIAYYACLSIFLLVLFGNMVTDIIKFIQREEQNVTY